jgi:hypothetical protein
MTTWRKGPPPSIGWWPASVCRDRAVLRWWNGQWWSHAAWPYTPAKKAAAAARRKEIWRQEDIEWAKRPASWPLRSKT